MLTKARTWLDFRVYHATTDTVAFQASELPDTWISLTAEKWLQMGQPPTITVTVEPGNTLGD